MGQAVPAVWGIAELIGKVVNYRYEVLEKCGDGHFFSVYKARDKVLNRLVAVKMLGSKFAQVPGFSDRLVGVVQTLTDLDHPNIAKVFEADEQDGNQFLAVEYVRGINLKDRIKRTAPFSISYAVDVAIAVAEALDYAHRNGIVHGDVRPHNILTRPDGQIKLTDFGMTAVLSAHPAVYEEAMARSVHYAAPELIHGEAPAPESDVYSLGVVLYEMLTGSVPYDGSTSTAVVARLLQNPVPSPHDANSGVPQILNEIVMKAMQKDPAKRYAGAAEMAAALRRVKEWLRTGETPAWPPRQKEEEVEDVRYDHSYPTEYPLKSALVYLLTAFVVIIVTAVSVVMLNGGFRTNELVVPNLVGMTWEQASEIAGRTGLELQEHRREYNDRFPAGQIYMTNPREGSAVPKDSPFIKVWISRGPKLLLVPDVVGLRDTDARRRIADAGLVPGRTASEYSGTVPAERVISQSPPAGQRLEPLKPVDIVVSLGEEPLPTPEMPDVSQPDLSQPPAQPQGETPPPSPQEPKEREYSVDVSIPARARGPQLVRIEVLDAYGEVTAYEDTHQPGEKISRTVRGFGDPIEIKVYVNNALIKDIVYSGGQKLRDQAGER
ncbi:MAG: protein kinase [Armatimonadetes bacterium]|nr:protein kinase [Armatimonadota bacterium]